MSSYRHASKGLQHFQIKGPDLVILDTELFCHKLFERLTICRDLGCFNACWSFCTENEVPSVTVVFIDQKTFKIQFFLNERNTSLKLVVVGDHPQNGVEQEFATNPLEDAVAFEELYLYIHHTNAGLCRMKQKSSTAPLTRIDILEERVDALFNAMEFQDGVARENIETTGNRAKRSKTVE